MLKCAAVRRKLRALQKRKKMFHSDANCHHAHSLAGALMLSPGNVRAVCLCGRRVRAHPNINQRSPSPNKGKPHESSHNK